MTEAEFRALAAQGYNRIPLVLETFADLDTPLSLYLKLANEPLHVPARVGGRRRALRPLLVHRPAGARFASARAAPRSRSTTAAPSSSGTTAIRWPSSAHSCAATARRRGPGCRASAAGSPALSATTRCATSRRSSPAARRRRDPGSPTCPTSCCCSPKSSRSSTTSPARSRSSSTPIPASRTPTTTARERLQDAAPQAARAGVDSVPDGDRGHGRRRASSAPTATSARCGARRNTSPPAT